MSRDEFDAVIEESTISSLCDKSLLEFREMCAEEIKLGFAKKSLSTSHQLITSFNTTTDTIIQRFKEGAK